MLFELKSFIPMVATEVLEKLIGRWSDVCDVSIIAAVREVRHDDDKDTTRF